MSEVDSKTLRAGVAGLGMAGAGIIRQLSLTPGVELAAAADENALAAFKTQYDGRIHQSFERLRRRWAAGQWD